MTTEAPHGLLPGRPAFVRHHAPSRRCPAAAVSLKNAGKPGIPPPPARSSILTCSGSARKAEAVDWYWRGLKCPGRRMKCAKHVDVAPARPAGGRLRRASAQVAANRPQSANVSRRRSNLATGYCRRTTALNKGGGMMLIFLRPNSYCLGR